MEGADTPYYQTPKPNSGKPTRQHQPEMDTTPTQQGWASVGVRFYTTPQPNRKRGEYKIMKATVRKVHPHRMSRNGNSFIRVEFVLEDGKWAETDLCPDYRNFSRWTRIIDAGVGTEIDNIRFKRPGQVDGDSFPRITKMPDKDAVAKLEQPTPTPKQEKEAKANGVQQQSLL